MKDAMFIQLREVEKLAQSMGGVFSTSDLEALFSQASQASQASRVTLFSVLKSAQAIGVIKRFTKGLYVCENFDPEMLSARICFDAYISMGTILAKEGLIGTVPGLTITAIRTGRNRNYENNGLKIKHFGISQHLYFGFKTYNGIKYADPEKAFIDVLYYQMRGQKYAFNPTSDIDFDRLDKKRCEDYLSKYKNPKFITYCRDVLYEKRK